MTDNTNTDLTAINDDMFSDARIEMVRNTVAKGAPAEQFSAMIDIAKRRNLDPLARQISLIRFGSSWQMIVTIDGYRAIAAQTGEFAGKDAPVFTWPDAPDQIDGRPNPAVFTNAGKRKPESCTVTVYKLIRGNPYPFSATVYFDEFDTGNNRWNTGPKGQLAKVAESHALRMAFPSVISGTYTEEEMEHVGPVETSGRVVDRATGEIHEQPRRPARNEPTPIASGKRQEPQLDPQAVMNRLHGIADKRGMTHDDIRKLAIARAAKDGLTITSTKECPPILLAELANGINSNAQPFLNWLERERASQSAPDAPQNDETSEQEESPADDGYEPSQTVIEIDPEFEADYRAKADQYTR